MTDSMSSVIRMSSAAQREFQSFLKAVAEMFGAEKTEQAGEYWLTALEHSDTITSTPEKFFRKITIEAARQLASQTA